MASPVTFAVLGVLALAAPPAAPPAPPVPHLAPIPPVPPVPPAPPMRALWDAEEGVIPSSFEWSVKPTEDENAPAGQVDFQLGYRTDHHSSTMGSTLPAEQLEGLTRAQLDAEGQPVAFVLRRDAGAFSCKGVAGQGRGVGTCAYASNPAFAGALGKRGIAAPNDWQQFQLAMFDIGLPYLDELKRERYATPTLQELVMAGTHGAGLKQLKAMDAVGYHFGDVSSLIRVRDHGVSARYIEGLRGYGYTGLTPDQLVRLRDHGVSTAFIGEMRAAGYSRLTAEDYARLRDHGVTAGFATDLRAQGYDKLSTEDLIRMRDHGVTTGFVRSANREGARLSPDELIQLRDTGGRR